jgi:DNA polymerase III sliding clamp (beta) subunit (PCNA family)
MKFTIEAGSFIRMVQMVSERVSKSKRVKPVLRLTACEGRACVQSADRVAETEARIWEQGECTLPQARLLKRLKAYPRELNLTVEADEQGLRLGHSSMPVITYASRPAAPANFQIFLASDFGLRATWV